MWLQPCTVTYEPQYKNQHSDYAATAATKSSTDVISPKQRGSYKIKTEKNFDGKHNARSLSTLQPGEKVWLFEEETMATVQSDAGTRSYNVNTESKEK